MVMNVGATSDGSVVVIESHGARLQARLGQFNTNGEAHRP
jgi:hypothetical protein